MAADTMPKVYCTYWKNHFKIFIISLQKNQCILHFMNYGNEAEIFSATLISDVHLTKSRKSDLEWNRSRSSGSRSDKDTHRQLIWRSWCCHHSLGPSQQNSSFLHSQPVQTTSSPISLNHPDKTLHTTRHPSTACYSCMNRDLITDALNHPPLNILNI